MEVFRLLKERGLLKARNTKLARMKLAEKEDYADMAVMERETILGDPPIFVGGAGRSGTTLIRVILDSHPNIACGPELNVTPMLAELWYGFQTAHLQPLREYLLTPDDINRIFGRMILSLVEKYRRQSGKRRVAEKSPNNVFFFQHLSHIFPESPLIHVVRDGRDVVCSLLTMDWVDPTTGQPVDYTRDPHKAAQYWASAVSSGRRAGQDSVVGPRYMELRYEDIVSRPEHCLRGLFAFLGEPWDPAVLDFHEQKRSLAGESSAEQVSKPLYAASVGRWKDNLDEAGKRAVKDVAGDLLIELGYATDLDW